MCDRAGCENASTHQAEVVIYARIGNTPATGVMGISVCDEHATEETARELLTDAGKRKIEDTFRQLGRALPDWSRSYARWKKIVV